MLPGWVELSSVVRDAAAKEGVYPGTIRRRILALNHAVGGGLVRSFHQRGRKPRKYWVHLERLAEALQRDPDARAAELDWLAARVEDLEKNVAGLKRAHKRLKQQVFPSKV